MRAKFKLGWDPSVSTKVVKQIVEVAVDGVISTSEFGRDVAEVLIDVAASTSVLFLVKSIDEDGDVAVSQSHSFNVGDLIPPAPATNLRHELVQVYDETAPVDPIDPIDPNPTPEPEPEPEPLPEPTPEPNPAPDDEGGGTFLGRRR